MRLREIFIREFRLLSAHRKREQGIAGNSAPLAVSRVDVYDAARHSRASAVDRTTLSFGAIDRLICPGGVVIPQDFSSYRRVRPEMAIFGPRKHHSRNRGHRG